MSSRSLLDAFPPSVNSPASSEPLFLSGAGLTIEGRFDIFNAVGVYLDRDAVPSLSVKWKGKTAVELTESYPFYREIITGPFEKIIKVFNELPLARKHYPEKLTENCVAKWKSLRIYTESEDKAVKEFLEVFKNHITFPPGSSILFVLSPDGSTLTVAFSNDDNSIPETGSTKIENKLLAEAVLESIIGKKGLAPEAWQSLAKRLAKLMNTVEEDATRTDQEEATVWDLCLGF